jgi:hypothetical protein
MESAMGKAKKKATPSRRVRKMPVKLSVDEAFHLLRSILEPHAASERLNLAIRTDEICLWVNDKKVDANFFATSLRIAARVESDGRWVADIEPTRALKPGEYVWTVSRAAVENLLQKEARAKRNAGGAPRKFDHGQIVLQAVAMMLDEAVHEKRGVDWLKTLASGLPRDQRGKQTLALLCEQVALAMGDDAPGDTLLKEILSPVFNSLISHE